MKKLICLFLLMAPFIARADWYASQSWVLGLLSSNGVVLFAGTNVVLTTNAGKIYINVPIPSNTNALTAGQSNILALALTNPAAFKPITNNFSSYGRETYRNRDFFLGGDFNNNFGFESTNTSKLISFAAPTFNDQNVYYAWLASMSLANEIHLTLGGQDRSSGYFGAWGVTEIDFVTAPSVGSGPAVQWMIDSNGNFYPFTSGSLVNLGAPSKRVNSGYLSNLDATVSVKTGMITNGNMIILSSTNVAPPNNNPNYVWVSTATNAPGYFFVGSNGVWVRK